METARSSMELPGVREETEHGPLRRIVTRRPLDSLHGGVAPRELLGVDGGAIARFALDESFAGIDPSRLAFLDTETTGLAGGTGTVPFLVGIARIEGDEWVVEQWFLERFGQEAPILRRLAEVLDGASGLVTYNGKSFDWPLLRARYVLHRLPVPAVSHHLDLVHGARRVLKGRLSSVRLSDVERDLLGFAREDDVDGSEIPAIYLEFQRSGVHPDLPRVVRHHALDLVAMPSILVRFARFFAGDSRPDHEADRLACARTITRARARAVRDDASTELVRSLLGSDDASRSFEAELHLAKDAKRAGDAEDERAALERALAVAPDDEARCFVAIELAKLLERDGDRLADALAYAERAYRLSGDEGVTRRIERLRRKLAAREARAAVSGRRSRSRRATTAEPADDERPTGLAEPRRPE